MIIKWDKENNITEAVLEDGQEATISIEDGKLVVMEIFSKKPPQIIEEKLAFDLEDQ